MVMTKIQPMNYVFIVNDKKLKGSGLNRGDIMMVTGIKPVPASSKDPYLNRDILVVVKVDSNTGEHLIPTEGKDHKAYLIDPRNVEILDDASSKIYSDFLLLQYGKYNASKNS
jgi:hypothetical protein